MRLHDTLDLTADAADAALLLADPELSRAVARRVGALAHDVVVAGSPDGAFTVTSRVTLPTDSMPTHLRGLVGPRIEVRQVESWQAPSATGARVGTIAVEIPGAPVRVAGRLALTPTSDATCRIEHEGEVRASVPLFGAAVEQAAAGALRRALDAQHAELRERAGRQ